MKVNNPLYKNQGIHVISAIFTVEKGITKVLLIKRKNTPYKDTWALVGGALYNNENIEDGMRREINEKTGIDNIELHFSQFFGEVNRSPVMRMIALSYLGVIDCGKVSILKETANTSDSDWFPLDNIPPLAYDHKEILSESIKTLQAQILSTDILKALFPKGFTIPEIQKTYESILGKEFDRRNFRKKLLGLDLIIDTNQYVNFEGKKPAKIYTFKNRKGNKNVF